MDSIINRVANGNIDVYNLASLWPDFPILTFDMKPFLYRGLILREKDFRQSLKTHDWNVYTGKGVVLSCSTDAILPTWAWMLVANRLESVAAVVATGSEDDLIRDSFVKKLANVNWQVYAGRNVVIKGCGDRNIPTEAYIITSQELKKVAAKIMYGEPCSAVPIWKKPKLRTNHHSSRVKPVENLLPKK